MKRNGGLYLKDIVKYMERAEGKDSQIDEALFLEAKSCKFRN